MRFAPRRVLLVLCWVVGTCGMPGVGWLVRRTQPGPRRQLAQTYEFRMVGTALCSGYAELGTASMKLSVDTAVENCETGCAGWSR